MTETELTGKKSLSVHVLQQHQEAVTKKKKKQKRSEDQGQATNNCAAKESLPHPKR